MRYGVPEPIGNYYYNKRETKICFLRKLKTSFSFVVFSIFIVFLLTACGDGGKKTSNTPSMVTNVSALNAGDGQVTIRWDSVSGASSYNIYWNITGTVTNSDGKISGIVSPFTHTGLTNGTRYYYIVTAINSAGESSPSVETSAIPILQALSKVNFTDSNLEVCINALGLTYAHEVTNLFCGDQDINDLSGIEKLTNLTDLNLSLNSITDVSPLALLINLTSFTVIP